MSSCYLDLLITAWLSKQSEARCIEQRIVLPLIAVLSVTVTKATGVNTSRTGQTYVFHGIIEHFDKQT